MPCYCSTEYEEFVVIRDWNWAEESIAILFARLAVMCNCFFDLLEKREKDVPQPEAVPAATSVINLFIAGRLEEG